MFLRHPSSIVAWRRNVYEDGNSTVPSGDFADEMAPPSRLMQRARHLGDGISSYSMVYFLRLKTGHVTTCEMFTVTRIFLKINTAAQVTAIYAAFTAGPHGGESRQQFK